MSLCKKCIYGGLCRICYNELLGEDDYVDECQVFKNKADFVEVVRCKDCKHCTLTEDGEYNPEDIVCGYFMTDGMNSTDFCSYGERRGTNG